MGDNHDQITLIGFSTEILEKIIFSNFDIYVIKTLSIVCKKFCYIIGNFCKKFPIKDNMDFLQMNHLICIDFSNSLKLNDSFLEKVLVNCKNLKGINLTGCVNLTDKSINNLIKKFKEIQYINLSGCNNICDSIKNVIENCKFLKHISIAHLHNRTHSRQEYSFLKISEYNNYQIKTLNLSGCIIKDEVLIHIFKNCKKLENFMMRSNSLATDKAVESLYENCLLLEFLDLSWCHNIILEESLILLAKMCKKLKVLKITRSVFMKYKIKDKIKCDVFYY